MENFNYEGREDLGGISLNPFIKKNQSFKFRKDAVFSYTVRKSLSEIVLQQDETAFSLSIKTEILEGILRVKSFHLNCPIHPEETSMAIYEAAIIDIVLCALKSLFVYARQQNIFEIFFMLSEDEAKPLMLFEGLWETYAFVITREGKRIAFSLFPALVAHTLFLKKTDLIQV